MVLRLAVCRRLAAVVLLAAFATATAAPLTLDAGRLRAEVATNPWRLTFRDAAGAAILVEAPERGLAPGGALGFRTAAGWHHATRVRSWRRLHSALTADLETDDPLGRGITVTLSVDSDGVIALAARVAAPHPDIEALGIGFEAESTERFLGFGERADAVDQRGRVVENYVADGPYQEEERPLVGQFVPKPGFRARDDATYFPVPWLLSSRGVGVLSDNDETSYFRLGTNDQQRWSFELTGAFIEGPASTAPEELRLRVFAGPRPADVLRRFTARTGRQPPPDAPWVFGPWIQLGGPLAERVSRLAALRAADAPVSVVQTYTHFLPCGDHVGNLAGQRAQIDAMHAAGVAITTYFNPMICESYQPAFREAVAMGALTRTARGTPYVYDYTGSTIFRVGQFDFSRAPGREFYGRLLREATDAGYDGWMEDFGEYTPLDAVAADGATGSAHHNRYATQYHCGAHQFVRRLDRPVVRFQRSGWTGAASCAQVVWNGDPSTSWGFDGLTSAVRGAINMGLSGVAVWGSDIGGFFAFGDRALTPELLVRWVQFGAVSGVMRTQHNGFSLPTRVRPQIYDAGQLPNWTRYAKLRTQLYPYLTAAAAEYARTGLPLMRHLALVAPDDPVAVAQDDVYLFGPDLLAAPVLTPGAVTRDAYLPAGLWVDLWRAGTWDVARGSFGMRAAAVLEGARTVTVPAPLEELPLFVRAGAVIPLLPPEVDTLAAFGDPASGLVRLQDRAHELALLAFPRGRSTAHLSGDRDRLRSSETARGWEVTIAGGVPRRFSLDASLATLERPFEPCDVSWRGRSLAPESWSFDGTTGALQVRFSGQRGRLVVHAFCG